MSLSINLQKPVTFATADIRMFESEAPKECPICKGEVWKHIYGVECTVCLWEAEFKEEQSEPTRYDYESGIIIK